MIDVLPFLLIPRPENKLVGMCIKQGENIFFLSVRPVIALFNFFERVLGQCKGIEVFLGENGINTRF